MKKNSMKKTILQTNAAIILFVVIMLLLQSNLHAQVEQKNEVSDFTSGKTGASGYNKTQLNSLKVLQSNEQELVVQIEIPSFEINLHHHQGQTYQQITIPGFEQTYEPGKPQLPSGGYLFGIPIGSQAKLEILDTEFTVEHNYLIYPAPKRFIEQSIPDEKNSIETRNVREEFYMDQNFYESGRFYPEEIAKKGQTF
jgi:hypothetical protein